MTSEAKLHDLTLDRLRDLSWNVRSHHHRSRRKVDMTNEPDIKGLEEFYTDGDKNSPRFFAGRREIVSAIETTVDKLRKDIGRLPIAQVRSNQRTWLIQGAPGAGKTALQEYLTERWKADNKAPVVVDLQLDQLHDQQELTAQIADRIMPDGAQLLMTGHTVSHTAGVDASVTASRTTTESVQQRELRLRDLQRLYRKPNMHWLQRLLPFGRRKVAEPRPIVLMIDEIQTMAPDCDKVLLDLHMGVRGLPAVLLLAGLAWSQERLREAGISRFNTGEISHLQTLPPLQLEEAAESVKLMLRAYHVTGVETEEIASWIAGMSDGWPQHLRHYMRALAGELAARKGKLREVNRDWIKAEGDKKRQAYYKSRATSPKIMGCTVVLADVARFIGVNYCRYSELVKMLNGRRWQEDLDPAEILPEGMKPQEFIQEMIRSGMIHSDDHRVQIPIPSFRRFLMEHYEDDSVLSDADSISSH